MSSPTSGPLRSNRPVAAPAVAGRSRTRSPRVVARRRSARGASLAALMFGVAIMGIFMAAASQQWSFIVRRELERELVYRGSRYQSALDEHRARTNALPTKLEDLTKLPKPSLRRVWADPMTARYDQDGELIEGTGEWKLIGPQNPANRGVGQATTSGRSGSRLNRRNRGPRTQAIRGVSSQSEEISIASWGEGFSAETAYNEWTFEVLDLVRSSNRTAATHNTPDQPEIPVPGYPGIERPPGAPAPTQQQPNAGLGQQRSSQRRR
ncbi:MAG: hypothetical protein AAF533_26720 [Acidobacteriota bacterium]